jgi:hypothetical protein
MTLEAGMKQDQGQSFREESDTDVHNRMKLFGNGELLETYLPGDQNASIAGKKQQPTHICPRIEATFPTQPWHRQHDSQP